MSDLLRDNTFMSKQIPGSHPPETTWIHLSNNLGCFKVLFLVLWDWNLHSLSRVNDHFLVVFASCQKFDGELMRFSQSCGRNVIFQSEVAEPEESEGPVSALFLWTKLIANLPSMSRLSARAWSVTFSVHSHHGCTVPTMKGIPVLQ